MTISTRGAAFAVAGGVFMVDRLSKLTIQHYVSLWDTYVVIPNVFNIVHAQNRGAAFGVLNDARSEWLSLVLIVLALAVAIFLVGLLWQTPRGDPERARSTLALSLVLGGAAGNIYDRIVTGSVTDFLQFFIGSYEWPSFNVADTAISIGAGLLLLQMWRGRRPALERPDAT